ncbi:MAG: CARDB domain-containing protein [Thermoplasmata archaeon]
MNKKLIPILLFAILLSPFQIFERADSQSIEGIYLDGNSFLNITSDTTISNITLEDNATLEIRSCSLSVAQSFDYENSIRLCGNSSLILISASLHSPKALRVDITENASLILYSQSTLTASVIIANGGYLELSASFLSLSNLTGVFNSISFNYSQVYLRDNLEVSSRNIEFKSSTLSADSAKFDITNFSIYDSTINTPIEANIHQTRFETTNFNNNVTQVSKSDNSSANIHKCKFSNIIFKNLSINVTDSTFTNFEITNTQAKMYNCSASNVKLASSNISWFWPIEITVVDARDFPIEGVDLFVNLSNGSLYSDSKTNSDGKAYFMLLSRLQNDTSIFAYAYDIKACYHINSNWINNSKNVNITSAYKEVIRLPYEIVKFGVTISMETNATIARLGTKVTLNATITNTGNARGTVILSSEMPLIGEGWDVRWSEGKFALNVSEIRIVKVTIQVPPTLRPSTYPFIFTARYEEDPSTFHTFEFNIITIEKIDLKVKLFIANQNPGVGDPVRLTATVTNLGTEHLYSVLVSFRCDDEEVGSETIELMPGESATITWTWTPSSSGTHSLTARAESNSLLDDANPEDNIAEVSANVAPFSTAFCYTLVVIGCVVGLLVLRWVSSGMQAILSPMLGCMIAGVFWGLLSILAQIPSNPECTYEILDSYVPWLGTFSAFAIIFYVAVHLILDRKILNSDFPSVSPFISLVLNIFVIIGKFSIMAPGWILGPLAYQTWLSLMLYFASRTVYNDNIIPTNNEENAKKRNISSNFVHFANVASVPIFLIFMPIIGPMIAEMIVSLILGLMLGIIGFYIYTRREDASFMGTITRVVSDSIPRTRQAEEQSQTQYGEVYASPSYESEGYYESYHEESNIPELPPEEEMPSSFRLPTQPPAFVRLRGPSRAQSSHVHGHKEKKKTIVRPGVVKLQEVIREKKCIACKTTENVTHVCAANDCGKYYCNDCASDIKQTCLDCGQPLKRIEEEVG